MVEILRLFYCLRVGLYEFRKIKCFLFVRYFLDLILERLNESVGCLGK